jgi:hypothetical protein
MLMINDAKKDGNSAFVPYILSKVGFAPPVSATDNLSIQFWRSAQQVMDAAEEGLWAVSTGVDEKEITDLFTKEFGYDPVEMYHKIIESLRNERENNDLDGKETKFGNEEIKKIVTHLENSLPKLKEYSDRKSYYS